MKLVHPLVRSSRVFAAQSLDGSEQRILVIVTTLVLDPASDNYNEKLVDKLNAAARNYVRASDHVTAYVLMNRMKDWGHRHGDSPRHHGEAATAQFCD